MTIQTIKLGLPFFDDAVGGVYLGLPTLVKGARNSGKSVLASHFVDRILRIGEKALVFCETPPQTAILTARSAGVDLEPAARSGQLLLVPVQAAIDSAGGGEFPFDAAIAELHALASRSSVGFVVFSSVVPWLAVTPASGMPRRVDAFLAALSTLSLTSLLLVHRPASVPAGRLVDKLVAACPVVLETAAFESAQRELRVVKCSGRDDLRLPLVFPLDLVPGKGLVPRAPAAAPVPEPAPAPFAPRPSIPPARHRQTLFGGRAAPPPSAGADPLRPKTLFGGPAPESARPAAESARSAAAAFQAASAGRRRATFFPAATGPGKPATGKGEAPRKGGGKTAACGEETTKRYYGQRHGDRMRV